MFSKNDIAKLARKILKKQRGLRDHQMIHPVREWFVGLFIAAIFLAAGATWSFTTYQELSERDVDTVEEVEIQQSGYRPETIDSALELFRERLERYEERTANAVVAPEPETEVPEATESEELPTEPVEPEVATDTPEAETPAPEPQPEPESQTPPTEPAPAPEEAGILPDSEQPEEPAA